MVDFGFCKDYGPGRFEFEMPAELISVDRSMGDAFLFL